MIMLRPVVVESYWLPLFGVAQLGNGPNKSPFTSYTRFFSGLVSSGIARTGRPSSGLVCEHILTNPLYMVTFDARIFVSFLCRCEQNPGAKWIDVAHFSHYIFLKNSET
jgi:hypothetical protein